MSYCRFENTKAALAECLKAIDNQEATSDMEISQAEQMVTMFLEWCWEADIIDGYEPEMIEAAFEDMREG